MKRKLAAMVMAGRWRSLWQRAEGKRRTAQAPAPLSPRRTHHPQSSADSSSADSAADSSSTSADSSSADSTSTSSESTGEAEIMSTGPNGETAVKR